MISQATVIETARIERLTAGDHEYDRGWETLDVVRTERSEQPNRTLSGWLHDNRPETGTYRLVTSWGARSDEVAYRGASA